jgi:hypothetical protein
VLPELLPLELPDEELVEPLLDVLPELLPELEPPELDVDPPSWPPEPEPPLLLVPPLPLPPLELPAPLLLLLPLPCPAPRQTGTVVEVLVGAAGWHVCPDGHPWDESQNGTHEPPMQISFSPQEVVPSVSLQLDPAPPEPAWRHP